uniref:Ig-like domain-containing protein n=1 Tax=Syphacia muris TaxID=451379 RepID=A0A0N5AXD1_9BILA
MLQKFKLELEDSGTLLFDIEKQFYRHFLALQRSSTTDIFNQNHLSKQTNKYDILEQYIAFEERPSSVEAKAGDTVTLKCSASGNPPPNIFWLFNNKPYEELEDDEDLLEDELNEGKFVVGETLTSSKLVIDCIQSRNAGSYACVAYNQKQRIVSEVEVTVYRGHQCNKKLSYAPRISVWTSERMENCYLAVQLYCRTSYNTVETRIQWHHYNGSELSDRLYKVLENGDLFIPVVLPEMLGSYICVATNSYGEDQITTSFIPLEPEDGTKTNIV